MSDQVSRSISTVTQNSHQTFKASSSPEVLIAPFPSKSHTFINTPSNATFFPFIPVCASPYATLLDDDSLPPHESHVLVHAMVSPTGSQAALPGTALRAAR